MSTVHWIYLLYGSVSWSYGASFWHYTGVRGETTIVSAHDTVACNVLFPKFLNPESLRKVARLDSPKHRCNQSNSLIIATIGATG